MTYAQMLGVELARPGSWHLASGKRDFSEQNLRDAADFFAASGQGRIPIGFGHTDPRFDGDPAFGWVANVRLAHDAKGPVLLGDLVDMEEWLAAAAPRRWPNRSVEGFANLDWNGRTYSLALTRLALLGSTPPAMPTLRSLADIREAIAAAAATSGAELISASAPTDPAPTKAVATNKRKKEAGISMDPAKFREALGLDEDEFSDDDVMGALATAGFQPAPEPSTAPEATPVAASALVTPTAIMAAAAKAGMRVVSDSVWDANQDTIKTLTDFVAETKRNQRDEVLASAVSAGKFTPAQKKQFANLWDVDPDGTRALIDTLTPNSALAVMASGYADETSGDEIDEYAALWRTNRKAG
jgi:hypothetical protein